MNHNPHSEVKCCECEHPMPVTIDSKRVCDWCRLPISHHKESPVSQSTLKEALESVDKQVGGALRALGSQSVEGKRNGFEMEKAVLSDQSVEMSHTVTGEGKIWLDENMSYEGVKKNGEPAGLYNTTPNSVEMREKFLIACDIKGKIGEMMLNDLLSTYNKRGYCKRCNKWLQLHGEADMI